MGFKKIHGLRNHPLYTRWVCMRSRCNDENNIGYKIYGGRGIKVCDEWNYSFQNFYNWSINNGFKSELVIDRIDSNANYCPENCRWATTEQNANNTSTNVKYEFNGEMLGIYQIARLVGIYDETLRNRVVNIGMSVYDAIELGNNRKKRSDTGINKNKITAASEFCRLNNVKLSYFRSKKYREKKSDEEVMLYFLNKKNNKI